jgi:hypothetical protein
MKRILVATLAAALLLTAGCARQGLSSGSGSGVARPAAGNEPAATPTTQPATGSVTSKKTATTHGTTAANVGAELDDIDKLLAGDSSPAADQD